MKTLILATLPLLMAVMVTQVYGQTGAALYVSKTCATCHGAKAEGNKALNAPALAGQLASYTKRQIQNFKKGIRGYNPTDVNGKVMQSVAVGLSDGDIDKLTTYLSSLPEPKLKSTLGGNPNAVKDVYAICAACHGQKAEGMEATNAPRLRVLNDWYIVASLQKYRDKKRGAVAGDTIGATMAPNLVYLPDDKALRDMAAYIHSLNK